MNYLYLSTQHDYKFVFIITYLKQTCQFSSCMQQYKNDHYTFIFDTHLVKTVNQKRFSTKFKMWNTVILTLKIKTYSTRFSWKQTAYYKKICLSELKTGTTVMQTMKLTMTRASKEVLLFPFAPIFF